MASHPQQDKGLRAKVIAGGGTALMIGGYIIYVLITGNLPGSSKDFTGEDLRNEGDRFRRADMVDSTFNQANISALDMFGCQLQESELIGVIAEGTDLRQASFLRSDLTNANFQGALLVEATFRNADLSGADLRGADIRGVNFDGTTLDGADLRGAITGPFCGPRPMDPLNCELDDEGCCHDTWQQTKVQGTVACTTPFTTIFSTVQNERAWVIGEFDLEDCETDAGFSPENLPIGDRDSF